MPKAICNWPGCNTLVLNKKPLRCAKHKLQADKEKPERPPDRRPNASRRGYDNRWQKARDYYIRRHPICEIQTHCEGAPAVDVDHIRPISIAPNLRLDERNLQSCCRACHNHKTKHVDPEVIREYRERNPELCNADQERPGARGFR